MHTRPRRWPSRRERHRAQRIAGRERATPPRGTSLRRVRPARGCLDRTGHGRARHDRRVQPVDAGNTGSGRVGNADRHEHRRQHEAGHHVARKPCGLVLAEHLQPRHPSREAARRGVVLVRVIRHSRAIRRPAVRGPILTTRHRMFTKPKALSGGAARYNLSVTRTRPFAPTAVLPSCPLMRPRSSTMSPRSFSFGVTFTTSHSKRIVSSA